VARNLYILAGTLLFFAIACFGMSLFGSRLQPGLPADGTLWKTTALFLTVGGLLIALFGVFTAMFEQVERRAEERRARRRY
jgi:TRAP-type C4-dicarboxylate transport system permease small subunit